MRKDLIMSMLVWTESIQREWSSDDHKKMAHHWNKKRGERERERERR